MLDARYSKKVLPQISRILLLAASAELDSRELKELWPDTFNYHPQ